MAAGVIRAVVLIYMHQVKSVLSQHLELTKCLHCGEPTYVDSLVCFRCNGLGPKREIYDKEVGSQDPSSFSDLYFGGANYEKLRKKNIKHE